MPDRPYRPRRVNDALRFEPKENIDSIDVKWEEGLPKKNELKRMRRHLLWMSIAIAIIIILYSASIILIVKELGK